MKNNQIKASEERVTAAAAIMKESKKADAPFPENGKVFGYITHLPLASRWTEEESCPRFSDDVASHSWRVGVYSLLCALIEKKKFHHTNLDLEQVVCGAIYHDINETIISPMKHRTKKGDYVRELIKQLEDSENRKIVQLLSPSLQPVFYNFIVKAEDTSTMEGKMVDAMDTFDSLMFCHRECRDGAKSAFFQEKTEELAEVLRNHELDSVRYMMAAFDEKGSFYHFLYEVMNMDRIQRFKGKFNTIEDQDAAHSFRATAIAIFFAVYEKVKHQKNIDLFRLVAKVLCHDIVEVRTGDVKGPVKHATPEMKEAFSKYEKEVADKMVRQLPDFLQEAFQDYMVNAKDRSYEGELVEVVDKVDALIKSNMERRINRNGYEATYRSQLKTIQNKFEQPSVIFFLAYILHDLDNPMYSPK